MNIRHMTIFVSVLLAGCDSGGGDHSGPITQIDPSQNEAVSFKAITRAWYEQVPDAIPPTPNGLSFEYDANEDPSAFQDLLDQGGDGG